MRAAFSAFALSTLQSVSQREHRCLSLVSLNMVSSADRSCSTSCGHSMPDMPRMSRNVERVDRQLERARMLAKPFTQAQLADHVRMALDGE